LNLDNIRIVNFRNHQKIEFQPASSVTIIHGPNGSGKTSILEAVHYCALTRGFSGSADRECLAFGEEYFSINSEFTSDRGIQTGIRVIYSKEKEKQIFVNEQELSSFSKHVGAIPCITFAPYEMAIVSGPPAERRRFVDTAICQYDRKYLDDLLQYRRILQQRNALLSNYHENQRDTDILDIWTEQLAMLAASIVETRVRFVGMFEDMFKDVYALLLKCEEPDIRYQCSLGKISPESSKELITLYFIERYRENRKQEIIRGQTMCGPHRDDLLFYINGQEVKKYSSQGQQRTFLIGIKLSLHRYLHEKTGEKPISLLDDLFSELDAGRVSDILDLLSTYGQVIITATEERKRNGSAQVSIEDMNKKWNPDT
jgi:DNA replication and repair protein RecF